MSTRTTKGIAERTSGVGRRASATADRMDEQLRVAEQQVEAWAEKGDSRLARAAQSDTVIQGVVVVIVATVGVTIVSQVDTSFDPPENTQLSQSQEGLLAGFGSMIDLIEPLLIILMSVILIAVVQRVRQ